jgi:S1-C subfamily serine protease
LQDVQLLEARLQALSRAARPTQVAITVAELGGGGSCSGTIIDAEEGWILTAGHCFEKPGQAVAIELPDGRTIPGTTAGLHCEGSKDCGLVKFDSVEGIVAARLGPSARLVEGDWLAPFGHTHGFMKDRAAVMRIGRVVHTRDHAIDLDAPMSGGDSGGGVFDLQGRLVGIVSTTSGEPTLGSMCTSDFATSRLADLKASTVTGGRSMDPAVLQAMWAGERAEFMPSGDTGRGAPDLREITGDLTTTWLQSVCQVMVDHRPVGMATVVDASGVLLAKDSDIGRSSDAIEVTLPVGTTVRARRVVRHRDLDLVVLKVDGEDFVPIEWAVDAVPTSGTIVVSISSQWNGESWGIIGLDGLRENAVDGLSGFLGIRVEQGAPQGPGLKVIESTIGSPAWVAGLRAGDRVLRLAGQLVSAQGDIGRIVRAYGGGELLLIEIDRDGSPMSLLTRVTVRPDDRRISQSTALFPASRRASGFGGVVQHDTPLPCMRMGGPLLGLDGRAIGINIARPDRTATYALPAARVKPLVAGWIEAAKAGTTLPTVAPIDLWPPMQQNGSRWIGHPALAELEGSSLIYAFDQRVDPGVIEGWTDPLARCAWVAELEPGAYDMFIEAGLVGDENRSATIDVGFEAQAAHDANREGDDAPGEPANQPDRFKRVKVTATQPPDQRAEGRMKLATFPAGRMEVSERGPVVVWAGRPGAPDLVVGRLMLREVDAAGNPGEDAPKADPDE